MTKENTIRYYHIHTYSESSDEYDYFLKTKERLTIKQIEKWLFQNGNDVDFESIETVNEIKFKDFVLL